MMKTLIVGTGGFLGAIARYGLSGLVHRFTGGLFPLGTLAVNLIGCFVIGGLMSLVEDRQMLAPSTRLFLGIGFLGSFTTFSTFSYETVALMRHGSMRLAALNVGVSVILGLVAVAAGWAAARAILS